MGLHNQLLSAVPKDIYSQSIKRSLKMICLKCISCQEIINRKSISLLLMRIASKKRFQRVRFCHPPKLSSTLQVSNSQWINLIKLCLCKRTHSLMRSFWLHRMTLSQVFRLHKFLSWQGKWIKSITISWWINFSKSSAFTKSCAVTPL
jgi:hypothetical protein